MNNENKIENISELKLEACDEAIIVESNGVEVEVVDLGVVKSANCDWTVKGGTVKFCTKITNPSDKNIEDAVFKDVLNPRLTYVAGTFTVNNKQETPSHYDNTLEYVIGTLHKESSVVICFKVRVK